MCSHHDITEKLLSWRSAAITHSLSLEAIRTIYSQKSKSGVGLVMN